MPNADDAGASKIDHEEASPDRGSRVWIGPVFAATVFR
jgi:hypothetical protein